MIIIMPDSALNFDEKALTHGLNMGGITDDILWW